MKLSKIFAVVLVLIGVAAIILGIVCYSSDVGSAYGAETYGGDAYTGIQRAAAKTSSNVVKTNKILTFGFGSFLFVTGLLTLTFGLKNFFESFDFKAIKNNEIAKINNNEVTTGTLLNESQETNEISENIN